MSGDSKKPFPQLAFTSAVVAATGPESLFLKGIAEQEEPDVMKLAPLAEKVWGDADTHESSRLIAGGILLKAARTDNAADRHAEAGIRMAMFMETMIPASNGETYPGFISSALEILTESAEAMAAERDDALAHNFAWQVRKHAANPVLRLRAEAVMLDGAYTAAIVDKRWGLAVELNKGILPLTANGTRTRVFALRLQQALATIKNPHAEMDKKVLQYLRRSFTIMKNGVKPQLRPR